MATPKEERLCIMAKVGRCGRRLDRRGPYASTYSLVTTSARRSFHFPTRARAHPLLAGPPLPGERVESLPPTHRPAQPPQPTWTNHFHLSRLFSSPSILPKSNFLKPFSSKCLCNTTFGLCLLQSPPLSPEPNAPLLFVAFQIWFERSGFSVYPSASRKLCSQPQIAALPSLPVQPLSAAVGVQWSGVAACAAV